MEVSKSIILLLFFGFVLTIVFSCLAAVWPRIYLNVLTSKLVLTDKSMSYNMWKETPFPQYMEIFLYNLTNIEDVLNNTEVKPHFEEKGPYVFKEHHIKVNTTWNDNGTVTFYQRRVWHFDEELTKGSLEDEITNINMVAATANYLVRHKSTFQRAMVNGALKKFAEGITVTKTVRELLFDGYEDKVLTMMANMSIPSMQLPFDKFGWFYGRNESDAFDGLFNMYTGAEDIEKLGCMDMWNHKNHVDFYDGQCGQLQGSAGELFPPNSNPQNISIFAPDICSSVTLNRDGVKNVKGVMGASFKGDASLFDNGQNYPKQSCFCRRGDLCADAGARNISQCKFGAPVFVSYPHFHLADHSYLARIDGITPDEKKDDFELVLELGSGIPLYAKAQLQINILVQHVPGITYFARLPDKIYIPVLWFRQEINISDDLAGQANLVVTVDRIVPSVFYFITAIGAVISLVGAVLFVKLRLNTSENVNK